MQGLFSEFAMLADEAIKTPDVQDDPDLRYDLIMARQHYLRKNFELEGLARKLR